jgi:hypothetical protein
MENDVAFSMLEIPLIYLRVQERQWEPVSGAAKVLASSGENIGHASSFTM